MQKFGPLLKMHIEANKLAKKEVAHSAGITYNYLSSIFHKDSIDAALLEKLCQASGLPISKVFDNAPSVIKSNSDNTASTILGSANITIGSNEKLYKTIIDNQERYIRLLEENLAELKGTKKEHQP